MIRNSEALGGRNVSHDAVKKVNFQSLFKSYQGIRHWRHCPSVSSKRLVQRQRKHGWQKNGEYLNSPYGRRYKVYITWGGMWEASVRGLTAVVERERVVRAVTEGTMVSMSILPCSIQLTRWRTGSQCSDSSSGLALLRLALCVSTRARMFWTRWSASNVWI